MHLPLLQDILILLGFSVAIVFILQRLKLPSILGFLISGTIIGPYGLSLVKAVEQVEVISEIGVILLLFVIGMELSIKQLARIKKTVFVGGFLQVGLTVLIAASTYYFYGSTWNESVFVGFLFSLSSTAIVLKVLQDRNEISTAHGKNALAILIFQDIIVVPMMLVTPIMAGASTDISGSIISLLIKSLIVIAITILLARYIVPRLMHMIAKTKSKELFLLTTITICFAVTFLTSEAGLSLALGAFLAGLIISESEYSHQATSIILPFRELFTSFFFISVGMLLDLDFFIQNVWVVLFLVLIVFIVKSLVTAVAVGVLKYPPKTVIITALSLFQVGEFAFILSKVGLQYNLLSESLNQYFLSVSITSMILTPFVIIYAGRIADWFLNTKIARPFEKNTKMEAELNGLSDDELDNHLIIVGYGINGSNLAKAAEFSNIPYIVIELNPETVRREKANGVPIIYGDAAHSHILNHVNVYKARAVVVAISDNHATQAVITTVRNITQSVYLLVRTRYVKEINELKALGADEVIPEEFETSVEIFSRILHNFLVPADDISQFIETVRSDSYHLFQEKLKHPKTIKSNQVPDFNITCIRANRDSGGPVGKSLREIDFRNKYGVYVIAISRKEEMISNISPDEKIHQNDLIYVQGDNAHIERFRKAIA
ncbi:MAG: monovalent cation:proton antiporter-2 (CPA2) family protein [Vicingaceae bacterium]